MRLRSNEITLPPGSTVRLCMRHPHSLVFIAPPGVPVDLDLLQRPSAVSGLLVHDRGLRWPDRKGCELASGCLENGLPVVLQFVALADALACHKRLCEQLNARAV